MDVASFIFGFLVALAVIAAGFLILYLRFARLREPESNIKGYLDLIPDLTQEQRDRVREIRATFLPKVERIRQNLCAQRAELARLLFEEPEDLERIRSVGDQILARQSELEREVIEHILEEKELLTASQRRRFYEIITEQFASGGLGVHDVKGRKESPSQRC